MQTLRAKISFKGVIIGGIADIVGTNIAAVFFIVFLLATNPLVRTILQDGGARAFSAYLRENPPLFAVSFLIGAMFSVIGGYVAAHIAKHHELLNGALSAWLCFIIGIVSLLQGTSGYPLWLELLLIPASPLLGMFGGYLKLKQRTR
jgi:hypothetical protein